LREGWGLGLFSMTWFRWLGTTLISFQHLPRPHLLPLLFPKSLPSTSILTFPRTTFLFQPASFPFPSKIDCVYLYYCSCPATAVTKPVESPLWLLQTAIVLLTKVTAHDFRKASPEVSAERASQPGYGDRLLRRCMVCRADRIHHRTGASVLQF
jgi:hypothetical protein